jgi:Tfp pilus assembly protein PilX
MRRAEQTERGTILVLALLVALILLGFGLAVMWVASSGIKSTASINRRQEAMYAAEAGVERARGLLAAEGSNWTALLGGCGCAQLDKLRGHILCGPNHYCLKDVQVVESSTRSWAAQSKRDPSLGNYQYTIWIRNDWEEECDSPEADLSLVDCDGDGSRGTRADITAAMQDTNGRVLVLVEGRARDGLSTVKLEVSFARVNAGNAAGSGYEGQKGMGGQGSGSLLGHTGS